MASVRVSAIIGVPIEQLWADVRDFATHARWIDGATETRLEGGTGTTVGVLRTVVVHGMVVSERLTGLDDKTHSLSYEIVGNLPLPMYNIHGSIAMVSDTSNDTTLVERMLHYDTPLPQAEAEAFWVTRQEILADSLRLLASLYA